MEATPLLRTAGLVVLLFRSDHIPVVILCCVSTLLCALTVSSYFPAVLLHTISPCSVMAFHESELFLTRSRKPLQAPALLDVHEHVTAHLRPRPLLAPFLRHHSSSVSRAAR